MASSERCDNSNNACTIQNNDSIKLVPTNGCGDDNENIKKNETSP